MKINYKGEIADISLGLGPSNEGTAIAIRYSKKISDQDGNPSDQNLGSTVFTSDNGDEHDLKFINDLKDLIQDYVNLKG